MSDTTRIVRPWRRARTVLNADGDRLDVPEGWELLPPGDAAVTRKVKAGGPHWLVQEQKGRRTFSRGVWAPAERVAEAKKQVEEQRSSPEYAKKIAGDRARRARKQVVYAEDFENAVSRFLDFHPRHEALAARLAKAVAAHATPVGSGTVARTERIPLERRVEAAVIAWLRHNTTTYENMAIPRVKGMRRSVRRTLARRSRELLDVYREGEAVDPATCPLEKALG